MRAIFVILPALVIAFAACAPGDQCTAGTTRCNGNTVEICGPDRSWAYQDNCDTIAGPNAGAFVCDERSRGGGPMTHACVQIVPDGSLR